MRRDLTSAVWGSAGWTFLRSCAHASDAQTRSSYNQFFRLLPEVLPCEACRRHTREYVVEHPPEAAADLEVWLCDFEAAVKRRVRRKLPEHLGVEWVAIPVLLVVAVAIVFAVARSPKPSAVAQT